MAGDPIERLEQIAEALSVHPATPLIEQDQLAALVARLAASPSLLSHVRFFVDTLGDDLPADPRREPGDEL